LVIERLLRELDPERLLGSLVMTPVSNPMSFDGRSKVNPYDNLDMDQQFPGNAAGQMSQRTASALMEILALTPDYLLSLHTLATPYEAMVYTNYRAMPTTDPEVEANARALAMAFGADLVCRLDVTRSEREIPGNITGSIDSLALESGIPAIMVELGGGGRYDEEAVNRGVRGVLNILRYSGMLEGQPTLPRHQLLVADRNFVYSDDAGLFVAKARAGDKLLAGEPLGTMLDIITLEERPVAFSQEDLFVIAIRRDPLTHTGDRLALVATAWEEVSNGVEA